MTKKTVQSGSKKLPTQPGEQPLNSGRLEEIAIEDAKSVFAADEAYGNSWRKRGGSQAFYAFARKWDRIENLCAKIDYDVFKAWEGDLGGIQDDIGDLRRYLLLLEEYMTREKIE